MVRRRGFRAWAEWTDPSDDHPSWCWTLLLIVLLIATAVSVLWLASW